MTRREWRPLDRPYTDDERRDIARRGIARLRALNIHGETVPNYLDPQQLRSIIMQCAERDRPELLAQLAQAELA